MPEEMRWRRPGLVAGRVVVRGTAVVVAAWVRIGRERLGVAVVVVASTTVVVWACERRGRCGAIVAPYIVVVGAVRKREVVEFVGVAAGFVSLAAVFRGARSCLLLFVGAMLDGYLSWYLRISVLVLAKENLVPKKEVLVLGGCGLVVPVAVEVGGLLKQRNLGSERHDTSSYCRVPWSLMALRNTFFFHMPTTVKEDAYALEGGESSSCLSGRPPTGKRRCWRKITALNICDEATVGNMCYSGKSEAASDVLNVKYYLLQTT